MREQANLQRCRSFHVVRIKARVEAKGTQRTPQSFSGTLAAGGVAEEREYWRRRGGDEGVGEEEGRKDEGLQRHKYGMRRHRPSKHAYNSRWQRRHWSETAERLSKMANGGVLGACVGP